MTARKSSPHLGILDAWLEEQGFNTRDYLVPRQGRALRALRRTEEYLANTVESSWVSDGNLRKNPQWYVQNAVGESIPRGDHAVIAIVELRRLGWTPRYVDDAGLKRPCATGLELAAAAESDLRAIFASYGYRVFSELLERPRIS